MHANAIIAWMLVRKLDSKEEWISTKAVSNVASGVACSVKVYPISEATKKKLMSGWDSTKTALISTNDITERNKGGGV